MASIEAIANGQPIGIHWQWATHGHTLAMEIPLAYSHHMGQSRQAIGIHWQVAGRHPLPICNLLASIGKGDSIGILPPQGAIHLHPLPMCIPLAYSHHNGQPIGIHWQWRFQWHPLAMGNTLASIANGQPICFHSQWGVPLASTHKGQSICIR